ncbi:MAG TPA: hypothetical protein VKB19_10000 [Pedobacter sp.]|nr:hypothetical protein [Pedobacter sp.]
METQVNVINPDDALNLVKTILAFDRSIAEFEANENVIFAGGNDLPKLIHSIKNKAVEDCDKAALCFYPECDKRSIKNSHTIQESSSLKQTAESGHLISPTGRTEKDSWIGKIGYHKASVFPGFCTFHENIFQEFEAQKDFKDERQIGLQLFRTICREISVNQEVKRSLLKWLDVYVGFRNQKLDERFYSELAKLGLDKNSAGIISSSYKFDNGIVRYLKKYLLSTRKYLRTLYRLKSAAFNDIKQGKEERFFCHAVVIDTEIPVCLAGRGGIGVKYGAGVQKLNLIINVLPLQGKTYLVAGSFHKHKKHIEKYFERYIGSPFNLLTLVESWMLYGSDHWFLKPSVWEALDDIHRQKIFNELYRSQKNIVAFPEIMIFKGLRLEIIKKYKGLGPEHSIIAGQLEALMN